MADGLSQGSVYALVQDSHGLVWIGTQDGLNRYNGHEFRQFRHVPEDSSSLADDFIEELYEDGGGVLWVGTERAGLARFDSTGLGFVHFKMPELGPWLGPRSDSTTGREGRTVWAVRELDGSLLVGTDAGPAVLDTVSGRAIRPDHALSRDEATALATDSAWAWVGYDSGVLQRYERTDGRAGRSGLSFAGSIDLGSGIRAMTVGPDGCLWIGTYGAGLFSVDRQTLQIMAVFAPGNERGLLGGRVLDLRFESDSTLWLGVFGGISILRLRSGEFVNIPYVAGDPWGLPDPEVTHIIPDGLGGVWIGTWNGLARLHPLRNAFRRIATRRRRPDGIAAGVIGIAPSTGGHLWTGTYGGGLSEVDLTTGSVIGPATPSSLLAGQTIYDLTSGEDGSLWVATFDDGVFSMGPRGRDLRRYSMSPRPSGEPETAAYSVLVDHRGDVWAGTDAAGLQRLDVETLRFVQFLGPQGDWDFGSPYIWPIVEDRAGSLWIGSFQGGLNWVSSDRSEHRRYSQSDGLSDDRILTLFIDSDETIWIGTQGGGLDRFDPETGEFRGYTVADGLPHDHVEGIIEDDLGFLWLSTNDGLARFDRSTGRFWVFKEAAGLAGNRFYANSVYKTEDGDLVFGGPDGLTMVSPPKIRSTNRPPAVALTDLRIRDEEVGTSRALSSSGLDLAPDENFFAFEFAALDYTDVTQNRYRYMLEPLDDDWVDIGNENVANYTSVPHGRYTFRVAARNSEGVWNEDGLTIPVRVQPHYYQTWWFQSAVVATVLLMISGFYAYRLQELRRRQNLRLDIAGKLHDDIGANLSTIALKAGMVGMAAALDDRGRAHLHDVASLARDSAHKVRETVWVVNTRYDTLAGLISKMRDTADVILADHVAFTFDEPAKVPDLKLRMETRQNIYLMFKEALHNVVKHASASKVKIQIEVEGGALTLSVEDDGVGFDAEESKSGSGQALLRHRASEVRGAVEVASRPTEGTAVKLRARLR